MEDFYDMIVTAMIAVEIHNDNKIGQKAARKIVAKFIKDAESDVQKHVHGIKSSKNIKLHLDLVHQKYLQLRIQSSDSRYESLININDKNIKNI